MNAINIFRAEQHPLHAEVDRMLLEQGGLYTFQDIIDEIHEGNMQSFVKNDSWIVTRMSVYPRKRVLHAVLSVGNIDEIESMHDEMEEFARVHGASLMITSGRLGYHIRAKRRGWKLKAGLFIKELR